MSPLPIIQPLLTIFSVDPAVRMMQLALLVCAVLVVFFVFYVLRDVVLRTDSFLAQLLAIIIVAFLPGIGFLLYILLRPSRTLRERQLETLVREIHKRVSSAPKPQPQAHQKHGQKKNG